MKTVLVDDEYFSLAYMEKLCLELPQLDVIATFSAAAEAIQYIAENPVDLLITDIEMPGLSGLDAVRALREQAPELGVIFVTGFGDYALEAFRAAAVAYLMKPCMVEDLSAAVNRAMRLNVPQRQITIRTFGYFSLALQGRPVRLSNSKAQELLALLVDRKGSVVTMEQAVDVLWESRSYDDAVKRLYRKAVGYLNRVFEGTGFFVAERGSCHIVPALADCDYFKLLEQPDKARGTYFGEYLLDYSWAEETNGKLTRMTGFYSETK